MAPGGVFRWFSLYAKCCVMSFALTMILATAFPNAVKEVFRKWVEIMKVFGAKTSYKLSSQANIFQHILLSNTVSATIFFVLGLLLQAPLAFAGIFYACVVSLAPIAIGISFGLSDWLLIIAEVSVFLLSAASASTLAGRLFGCQSTFRDLTRYWKQGWRKLLPHTMMSTKLALHEWFDTALWSLSCIAALLVFVAWLETFGT